MLHFIAGCHAGKCSSSCNGCELQALCSKRVPLDMAHLTPFSRASGVGVISSLTVVVTPIVVVLVGVQDGAVCTAARLV